MLTKLEQIKALLRHENLSKTVTQQIMQLIQAELEAQQTLGTVQESQTITVEAQDNTINVSDDDALPKDEQASDTQAVAYQNIKMLGEGGMGSVWLVSDDRLRRKVALKVLHPKFLSRSTIREQFVEEGQICAQLEHPNIVPVHELGKLPDGRHYFTMKAVNGKTLDSIIQAVHSSLKDGRLGQTPEGWSLRRMVDVFRSVCQGVAYAHSKGVLHRDLKPQNIMVGAFGEVIILDWGIAKICELDGTEHISIDRSISEIYRHQEGRAVGTPSYMSPEQAMGMVEKLTPQSDVYALGAILYHILSGNPPYTGSSSQDILQQVLTGPPKPIAFQSQRTFNIFEETPAIEGPTLPDFLVSLCEQAMARSLFERQLTAADLASAVSDWLDGIKNQEAALELVEQAELLMNQHASLNKEIAQKRAAIVAGLKDIPRWASEDDKALWWEKEQALKAQIEAIKELHTKAEQLLIAALNFDSDCEVAHLALIKRYRAEHEAAEREARGAEVTKRALQLKQHCNALSLNHPERSKQLYYLRGTGALSLQTEQADVELVLERFVPHRHRLKTEVVKRWSGGQLHKAPIEMGSYRIRLRKAGFRDVIYPVFIERGGHWDCRDPQGIERAIRHLHPKDWWADQCYVPAGWFWAGGTAESEKSFSQRRVWLDDCVVLDFPVTNRQYLAFLNHLVQAGREQEALQWAPRERAGQDGQEGALIWHQASSGLFEIGADADGLQWQLDWPVVMVDWFGAKAYAEWFSLQRGQAWQVIDELAWEKAARGVDARIYPWGNQFDPSYCNMVESHPEKPRLSSKDEFLIDQSVYGVQSLAGNVMEWTSSHFKVDWEAPSTEMITCRGGNHSNTVTFCRLPMRILGPPTFRLDRLGFRLCRYV